MAEARQPKRLKTEQEEEDGPSFSVPDIDCTRHNFFQEHPDLNDRQRFCWALQTEERVRFDKLLKRNDFSHYPASLGSCPHLIDLYPMPTTSDDDDDSNDGFGVPGKDWLDYQRKAVPGSMNMREIDESMHSCRMDMGSRRQMKTFHVNYNNVNNSNCAVPPNFLFFRIILEGFMGYNKLDEMPNYGDLSPRWAVMGGAVVASLTAWRNVKLQNWIADFERDHLLQRGRGYSRKKRDLIHQINWHFMYETNDRGESTLHWSYRFRTDNNEVPASRPPFSPMFSDGDVDVFLQASPLTTTVQHRIAVLPKDVLDNIGEYLGGCGFVSGDLKGFSKMLCEKLVATVNEDKYAFVYSVTKNGLSFMLTLEEELEWDANLNWPRCTQIIMMNEQADLVGGLLDFDISLATCAFDGTGVYLTPRSMMSIQTSTQIVTPFVIQEKRNRQRIVKYFKRGFVPYLLDPNYHRDGPLQTQSFGGILQNQLTDAETVLEMQRPRWRARELNPGYNPSFSEELVQACCRVGPLEYNYGQREYPYDDLSMEYSYPFSLYLFEREDGHAMRFFSNQFGWAPQDHETVQSFPRESRVSCRRCRELYATIWFMEAASRPPRVEGFHATEGLSPPETGDDVIHGDYAYQRTTTIVGCFFGPSFYSGGAFDSKKVGFFARTIHSQLSAMRAQHLAEQARLVAAEQTKPINKRERYRCRFLYSSNLNELFRSMECTRFPPNKRRPIGLNPERFMGVCESCQAWLRACKFGTRFCSSCTSKPA